MLRFFALLPLALAGCCPPLCLGPLDPPAGRVENWSDIEVVFTRVEGEVGPQQEIDRARLALSDPDGDGEFPLATLGFLVEPRTWSDPFIDPLDLYTQSVKADPTLESAGIQARVMAAARLRISLEEILSP